MILLRLLCSKLLSAVGVATTVDEALTPLSRLIRLAVRRSCLDVLWYVCLTALVFVLQLFDVFWSVCSSHVISICCSHVLMFSLSRNNMHVGIVGFCLFSMSRHAQEDAGAPTLAQQRHNTYDCSLCNEGMSRYQMRTPDVRYALHRVDAQRTKQKEHL